MRSPLLKEMDAMLTRPNLFPETVALIKAAIAEQEKTESKRTVSLTCAAAVAADLPQLKVHPTKGEFQSLEFFGDGSALVVYRLGCERFGSDGQPAKYQEPKGRH